MPVTRVFWTCAAVVLLSAATAEAKLQVVATLQDIGSVARFVGGTDVEVTVLCPGEMDPHFLPAKPSLARKMSRADLLVYNGMELEIGWLPQLIRKARNPDIRPGSPGDVDCSHAVDNLLEVPGGEVDRSEGDIHPEGNPHYTLDPRRMTDVARHLAERFAVRDPDHAADYHRRATEFATEVDRRLPAWREQTADARLTPTVIYHRNWAYLVDWLDLQVVGEIEHRPGIAPSPRHVQQLVTNGRHLPQLLVVAASWDHHHVAEEVASRAGASLAVLPAQVGAMDGVHDYFGMIDRICAGLAEAAAAERGGP